MKKIQIIIAVTFLMAIQITSVSARRRSAPVKLEKKVHNQYTVQANDQLAIDNCYGHVHINTWDKNQMTIDIVVTIEAGSTAEAQDMLDNITFNTESNENGRHRVYCKTVLTKPSHNKHTQMTIDYTINTPRINPMDISNKYGDVYLADFSGMLEMNVQYGSLSTQVLSGTGKHITVAYGNATINTLETGICDISYSNLSIDQGDNLVVNNKYGQTNIEHVNNLKIEQRYGNMHIGSVKNITGDADYANVDIGTLDKSADMFLKYCGRANFSSVSKYVDLLKLDVAYTALDLKINENANFTMDIKSSYGSVNHNNQACKVQLDAQDSHCTGKMGNGTANMTINSRYSNINLN